MFEDALLESGGRLKTHRAATTLASLLMQSALVGLLLLMPLIFPEAMPAARGSEKIHVPASTGARTERPMDLVAAPPLRGTSEITRENVLMAPSRVPLEVARIVDDGPPAIGPAGPGGPGVAGVGSGDPNSVFRTAIGGNRVLPPPVTPPPDRLVVSDGGMRAHLLNQVTPEYPRMARMLRIQGDVVLHAVISQEGHIERLRVISGPVQLRAAAEHAVRQWRYRPYLLNGKPTEVETQITVKFILGRD